MSLNENNIFPLNFIAASSKVFINFESLSFLSISKNTIFYSFSNIASISFSENSKMLGTIKG
jgi:hypothetical protein